MTAALDASILSKVIAAIQHVAFLEHVQISAETRFEEDLGLDSLDVTEVVFHIEDVFHTEFTSEVISRFRCVADVVRYLSRRFFTDTLEFAAIEG